MDYSHSDDETLIQSIARSRPEALSALYDRYSRLVFSLALHTVGDIDLAEEITQDVFFRVWEKAATYRPDQAKVSTWLTSVARNRAIDVYRQRRVRPEARSLSWEDLLPGSEPTADGSSPEERAVDSIQAQRVRAALAVLPVDQRQALALAYFSGYSHSEIASHLHEPLGTIKTRIRSALQKLRGLLSEEDPLSLNKTQPDP